MNAPCPAPDGKDKPALADAAAGRFLHQPDGGKRLTQWPSRYEGELDKKTARKRLKELHKRMQVLQELLAAENRRSVLFVIQAMDAAGKDSTVRRVFGPLNPATCRVTSFKSPTRIALDHDYLWRVHREVPARGEIGLFNRSHYEDVLIARVKQLVPPAVWRKRFDHLNAFEQMLTDEGCTIVKFYLHVSKGYQKQRLERRLKLPEKHWKFNPEDLEERNRWNGYMRAFQDAFDRCGPAHAPWHIVPSERRWFRDLAIAEVVVDTLERMNPQEPAPGFDPTRISVD